jgi:hypothetical protein
MDGEKEKEKSSAFYASLSCLLFAWIFLATDGKDV